MTTGAAVMPTASFHLRNAGTVQFTSRRPVVGDQSQLLVVHLRLQDWRQQQGESAIAVGSPIEWRFSSSNLNLFLLPHLCRSLVVAMLSHLPLAVDSNTLEEWIDRIYFRFQSYVTRALHRGYGAMTGVVEFDRFLVGEQPVVAAAAAGGVVEVDRFLASNEEENNDDLTAQIMLLLSEVETSVRDFGGVRASESSIQNLQTKTYEGEGGTAAAAGGGGGGGERTCVICHEDFSLHEGVTKMPCEHVFHGHCITQWLRRSHMCPLCRFHMPR